MMSIEIRKAIEEDLPTLLEFEQGVINFERPFDPTLKETPIQYYDIEKMMEAKEVALLVALDAGVLVASGYARIEKAKPYLKHQAYAYLGFMFVKETHRGRGINQQLITALENWCVKQNIKEMRLDVYNDNPNAIKAYEKSGFQKHLINMRKGV